MSSAGLGGKSDMDWTNTPGNNERFDPDMLSEGAETDETLSDINELGGDEPIGMIEVVEIETTDGGLGALGLEPTASRFRWWYVPAVALPVAAGATAGAIWLSRRSRSRRQPAKMYRRLVQQSRGLLDQVPFMPKRRAATPWQQGLTAVRESAKGLPDQASALRDRSAEALAAIDVAALLDQSRGIWTNALDQMNTLWERNAPTGKAAAKRAKRARKMSRQAAERVRRQAAQVGQMLVAMRAADRAATARKLAAVRAAQASELAGDMQKRVNQWLTQQRAQRAMAAGRGRATMAAARSRAMAPFASAARSTGESVKQTRRSINRGVRQAQALSLGILVGSIVTYVRVWRTRLNEREMRETAGGRMVRDAAGPVEAGALLP